MGEGIIVQLAEKWRVLKGNILQRWESNERSKWSSIEKLLWKEGGEFGFYVAVRIWDLFSLYSDKTLLGCVFFSSIQTVYTSVTLNFLVFTSSCLLKKKLFFSSFVIWENLRTKPLFFVLHTLTHICVNENISNFTAQLRNKYRIMQEYFVRDSIKSRYMHCDVLVCLFWKCILPGQRLILKIFTIWRYFENAIMT